MKIVARVKYLIVDGFIVLINNTRLPHELKSNVARLTNFRFSLFLVGVRAIVISYEEFVEGFVRSTVQILCF